MATYMHVRNQDSGVYGSQPPNLHYNQNMSETDVSGQQGGQVANDGDREADVAKNDNSTGELKTAGDQNCFTVVRTSKRLEIPCTRNEYRRYKVSVPKTVQEKVPRRVQYTDYETREREEPYTVKRSETAYREEEQPYTVQVPKTITRMVKVTKKVPKTVYVDVVTEEPQKSTIMVPETRTRKVKVPYQKQVVDQKHRMVKENVPVTKYRTEFDTVSKTIYEDAWRTKVVPVTKIVRTEIPVFNVVANKDCGSCEQVDGRDRANFNRGNPVRMEQATFDSDIQANAEVQSQPTRDVQYNRNNPNPEYASPAAAPGVMQQPEVQPDPSGAVHKNVARPPSHRQDNNEMVNRQAEAPVTAPAEAMSYHNVGQRMTQQEAAPVTNEYAHRYDPRMQQMYSVPPHYTTTNNWMR